MNYLQASSNNVVLPLYSQRDFFGIVALHNLTQAPGPMDGRILIQIDDV